KRRGLPDPLLVVTDGAPGLIRAVETCFPRALRQRCLAHRMRNLRGKVPETSWPDVAIRARACYEAASPALAAVLRDDFIQVYDRDLPAAVRCFLDDFEAGTAHLRVPLRHRKVIRTTNLLERLFGEARRRTKVVSHAFGERPVLKLMYAAVIRAADRWRGHEPWQKHYFRGISSDGAPAPEHRTKLHLRPFAGLPDHAEKPSSAAPPAPSSPPPPVMQVPDFLSPKECAKLIEGFRRLSSSGARELRRLPLRIEIPAGALKDAGESDAHDLLTRVRSQ